MEHCLKIIANKYPQLYLPIEKGISTTEEYRDVCLRGAKTDRTLSFSFNLDDTLDKFTTIAGDIDVLTLRNRDDFEHAYICLSNKCEPMTVPKSTGAITIMGLNNWDKVRANEDNYKDSIILLSCNDYSNVSSEDIYKETGIKLSKEEWINLSITIRKYHELTHFVMRKLYPDDIDFVRDEIIADSIGIIMAFNKFDVRLLKLFLGVESGAYRVGGRLENYKGGNDITRSLKLIEDIDNKIVSFNGKDIDYIWNNIKALM